jgi:hypothetical protein
MTDLGTMRKLVQAKRDLIMLSRSCEERYTKLGVTKYRNDALRLMHQAEGLHIAIHIAAGRIDRVIDDMYVES